MFLWLLLIVCMILHFDYHISGAVYGLDIKAKDAKGIIPPQLLWIRLAFHFLPLLYIMMIMWQSRSAFRLLNLILAGIYTIAHGFHFAGALRSADNPSQTILLGITLVLSVLLTVAAYQWYREQRLVRAKI
jgi:hypothetical protein